MEALRRINVPSVAMGALFLIAPKELRKQSTWYNTVTKFTRRLDEAVLPLAVGLIGTITGRDALARGLVWGLAIAIKDIYEEAVAKEPFLLVTKDGIEGWNFDANESVMLFIDGVQVTDRVLTDSSGHFKYETALSAGTHSVSAATSHKALSVEVAI